MYNHPYAYAYYRLYRPGTKQTRSASNIKKVIEPQGPVHRHVAQPLILQVSMNVLLCIFYFVVCMS